MLIHIINSTTTAKNRKNIFVCQLHISTFHVKPNIFFCIDILVTYVTFGLQQNLKKVRNFLFGFY